MYVSPDRFRRCLGYIFASVEYQQQKTGIQTAFSEVEHITTRWLISMSDEFIEYMQKTAVLKRFED